MADLFKATGTIHIDTSKIPDQVMEAAKEAQKTADKNSIKISITTDSKVMEKQLKKDQNTLFKELKDSYDKIGDGKIGSNAFAKSVQMYVASGGELNKAFEEIAGYYETLKKELKGNFIPIDQIELFKDALASLKKVGGNIDNSGIEELHKEIAEVKEDITSLKGRVDTLENVTAFDTLSVKAKDFNKEIKDINSSAIDLQKALIPLHDGINKVYQAKNGNQISGYWEDLKRQIDESDVELKELLKTIGLYDSKSDSLKLISDGMVNSGGLIGDERVLIARKNKGDRLEQTYALKKALDEAHASGINVSRILDIIGTKKSGVFLELQETAKGNVLGNIYGQLDKDFVNTEWLEATDEQVEKLISDMIALQKMGINVESNLTNIMYDKKKGFSFIDMDLDITKFENDAELMEDHMIRIFGDLEDFYLTQNDTANAKMIAKVRERFESLSEQVQQAYASAQDSHSPSKEFEKLENDAVDGVVEGAKSNEERLKNVGKQMADNIKDGFKEGISEIDTLPSGNQTPLSFFENESGQISMFEGIEDGQEKVEEAIKETNNVIEGQIDLLQHLSSLESKENSTSDDSEMNKVTESTENAVEAKKEFANANEVVRDSVDGSKSKLELETELMERLAEAAKNAANAKKEFVESNKDVQSIAKESATAVENETDAIKENANAVDENNKKSNTNKDAIKEYEKLNSLYMKLKGQESFRNDEFSSVLKNTFNQLNRLKELSNISLDIVTDSEKVEIESLKKEIDSLLSKLDVNKKSYTPASINSISNLSGQISDFSRKSTAASKEYRQELDRLQAELKQLGLTEADIDKIRESFLSLKAVMKATGNTGVSMSDKISKKFQDLGAYFATYVSVFDLIQKGREGFEIIKEYDTALTDMNKVSKESISTLKEFQQESFKLADAIGTTGSQIQSSTADFLRLGESLEEAKQSAIDANTLFKVSEFGTIEEATEALVAMSAAYDELEKSEINDILNNIGNNFPIATNELASALQRSAATLKVAGNDIYEATALVTAGNAVLQDAETVGSGLKMISLRILGTEEAKDELAALGENVDDFVVQTKSKLDETVRNYTAVASNAFKGISVLDENGNYRSTYEILRDISQVYQEIIETDKKAGTNRGQALLEVLAGENFCLKFMETYIYRTHLIARIA